MAQPLNANDVLEIVIEGENEGTPWNIVRHYLVESSGSAEADLAALSDYWGVTILGAIDNCLTLRWIASCTTITRVAPGPRNPYFTNFVAEIRGDITTDGLPNQNAALIRLTTDEPGRRNQGRTYLCGIPEASTVGGVFLDTALATLQTAVQGIKAPVVGGGYSFQPVIFSRTTYLDNPAAAVTAYTAVITDVDVMANIAIQRRRRYPRSVAAVAE